MNKSIALIAILAASTVALEECKSDYQCTLYDLEDFDESNGYYSFCLEKSVTGEYKNSSAYSFVYENTYGTFKPEELASYKCGAMVSIDFCHGVPDQTTDPDADY